MPDFVKNQLDFPEMALELPGLHFLSVKEIFQMFQNVTRDPQLQNESWVSSYIQACCEGPTDSESDENDIAEELKKEISEPGLEKDFFTQLELQDAKIWIGRFNVKENIVSRLLSLLYKSIRQIGNDQEAGSEFKVTPSKLYFSINILCS